MNVVAPAGGIVDVVVGGAEVVVAGQHEHLLLRQERLHRVGVKQRTAGGILNGRFPERVLEKAVERMLPKERPLARKQLTHLRIYAGGEHPHAAQTPETIAFAEMNAKNVRSQ